ncbi:hypothetical protein E4P42_01075 [Mycobacterium sp. PS03-16]|uniref:SIR2 family protein n=1 Tax=Mycobacterium sp. PS03-16 TaxID=2559611 RepID=UPI0010742909|nr:SIR2 family protein [Mycobacterium sp. PS03-16]TFV61519.1 hypothetical protein E4P42_01075 [Mycobacterium sp. PS03-16]
MTTGHLFVAQGDLTRLACDSILIPCDSEGNVNAVWRPLLPPSLRPSRRNPGWLVLDSDLDDAGMAKLPAADGRAVFAFATVDVDRDATPEQVAQRTWAAVGRAATRVEAHGRRVRPLVGLPLPGTGHGGLSSHRGKVIGALLERFRSSPVSADVALVLSDRRDFAAVQERRNDDDWSDLTEDLRGHADRLGGLAARQELALFIGAGVSVPVGLPDWWRLLNALAEEAGLEIPADEKDQYRAAKPIVDKLGARYHEAVRRQLDTDKHAAGHALLANLGVRRMVTTNFDCCMENALARPVGEFRVLTRRLAIGGAPWLLKINGDIQQPDSIVLTRDQLGKDPEERRALEGVVQSLLLTNHLLFVGFSLTDDNFLALAKAVSKVRQRAQDEAPSLPGTALALTADGLERAGYKELHMVAMNKTSREDGARTLEIFLDRLVWAAATRSDRASEYLLDDRYASGLSDPDSRLRDLLIGLVKNAGPEVRSSSGWQQVADCLRALGADDELLG